MSTIHPQLPPVPTPQPQGQRLTGQSALFALARAKTAETTAAPQAPQQPTPAPRADAAPAEPPQRYARPGSRLDIRV